MKTTKTKSLRSDNINISLRLDAKLSKAIARRAKADRISKAQVIRDCCHLVLLG